MTPSERARELEAGNELDRMFFEACLQWYFSDRYGAWFDRDAVFAANSGAMPKVSTDAAACEAWAMRWARERGLHVTLFVADTDAKSCLSKWHFVRGEARGTDWKHALVRACICAAETLTNGEPKHD